MFHLHLDIDRLRYMMLRITPVGMTERSVGSFGIIDVLLRSEAEGSVKTSP